MVAAADAPATTSSEKNTHNLQLISDPVISTEHRRLMCSFGFPNVILIFFVLICYLFYFLIHTNGEWPQMNSMRRQQQEIADGAEEISQLLNSSIYFKMFVEHMKHTQERLPMTLNLVLVTPSTSNLFANQLCQLSSMSVLSRISVVSLDPLLVEKMKKERPLLNAVYLPIKRIQKKSSTHLVRSQLTSLLRLQLAEICARESLECFISNPRMVWTENLLDNERESVLFGECARLSSTRAKVTLESAQKLECADTKSLDAHSRMDWVDHSALIVYGRHMPEIQHMIRNVARRISHGLVEMGAALSTECTWRRPKRLCQMLPRSWLSSSDWFIDGHRREVPHVVALPEGIQPTKMEKIRLWFLRNGTCTKEAVKKTRLSLRYATLPKSNASSQWFLDAVPHKMDFAQPNNHKKILRNSHRFIGT